MELPNCFHQYKHRFLHKCITFLKFSVGHAVATGYRTPQTAITKFNPISKQLNQNHVALPDKRDRERGGVKPARGLSYIVDTYPDLDHGAALERERRQVRLQPQLVVLGHDVGRQSLEGRLGR